MDGWRFLFALLLTGGTLPPAAAQIVVTPRETATQTPTGAPTEDATPEDAGLLLTQARAAAAEARANGRTPTPDQPDWREAVRLGEAARALAPDDPQILRFLAETYSTLSWDSRAWDAWSGYLDEGGTLDDGALAALSEAGRELGFARYSAGQFEEAAAVFERVLELNPDDLQALTWLGRIALETGASEAAQRYWARVLELDPENEAARYYVGQSEQQLRYGAAATDAFNEGLIAYDAGRTAAALDAFIRAANANPEFDEAASWAGRVALELGRPGVAQRFWKALLERDPENRQVAYFLSLADAQERWGVEAGRAFYAGQEAYNRGEVGAAAERFAAASDANPRYPEAASWAARSLQEAGRAERAIPYWERLLTLEPDNEGARYFLELARSQTGVQGDAAQAFNEGVEAYGEAQPERAQALFEAATRADPDYAEAWGWLGRLAFESGRYSEAEAAYARALELEPDNATYRFFQLEAERLGAP
jgi:tetratricopeptide (TPR) repeat protein